VKILLVKPSTQGYAVPPPEVPTGLLYLSAVLKESGHEVTVADLEFEGLPDVSQFDVCGMTILSKCRKSAFNLALRIKAQWPSVRLIAGGPHVSSCALQVINNFPFDAVVSGEGENCVEKALEVDGMVEEEFIRDIDELPIPDYDNVKLERYYMQIARTYPSITVNGIKIGDAKYAAMITSRGCVGRCTYCNAWKHWGLRLRIRNPILVADEMELLNKKYGVSLISFNDNAFGGNKESVLALCQEINRRQLKIAWKCDTRPDFIDEEMAVAMRSAGCFCIAVGLESGSPAILAGIRKPVNLNEAREKLLGIKRAGIICYVLLMIGNPGETDGTIKETVQYVTDIRPHLMSWVQGVMILPNTYMNRLNGTDEDFWVNGDDLPFYLKEHTQEELGGFAMQLQAIPRDPIPFN